MGWNVDAVLLLGAGIGLTFGLWWTYFAMPFGEIVAARRDRAFVWGYCHLPLYGSLAAVGAGLHVAAYFLEHHTKLGAVETVLCAVVPVALYVAILYGLYTALMREGDPFHIALLAGTAAILVLTVLLATWGVSVAACFVVLALAPVVTVIGFETLGHRHVSEMLARTVASARKD